MCWGTTGCEANVKQRTCTLSRGIYAIVFMSTFTSISTSDKINSLYSSYQIIRAVFHCNIFCLAYFPIDTMVSFTVFKGSKTGAIIESKSTREVGPDEVLVKITHSGVCGTDEHFLHADMVLGHEGAGVIEARISLPHTTSLHRADLLQQIGSSVTKLKTSDHVGWGWVHSACGDCKHCLAGKDNLCPNSTNYGDADLDQGSFGTYAVWKAAFVYKIPGTMKLEHAAPLMCE